LVAMSACQHFHGMFRQSSLPRVDQLAAPEGLGPVMLPTAPLANGNFFKGGFGAAEVFPHQSVQWTPCDQTRRRWTQPVMASQREASPVVGRASLPPSFGSSGSSGCFEAQRQNQYACFTLTPRGYQGYQGYQVSTVSTPRASSGRSASVGALRQPVGPLGAKLAHGMRGSQIAAATLVQPPATLKANSQFNGAERQDIRERMEMQSAKPPPNTPQSWQPVQDLASFAASISAVQGAGCQLTDSHLLNAEKDRQDQQGYSCRPSASKTIVSKVVENATEETEKKMSRRDTALSGLLTPLSQRSKKSPSSFRSTSSIVFPGSFVLRQPRESRKDGDGEGMLPFLPKQSGEPVVTGDDGSDEQEQTAAAHSGLCARSPNRSPDEIGDFKLSPVPISPSSSAFASFSPGDIDFGQREPERVEVVKADAETQTSHGSHGSHGGGQSPVLEQTPPRRLRQSLAPRMLALSQRGILPACVSALAMREETEAHNRCCLRKLEMRIAPCWRDEQGFKEAEHSSLQVSSTQSPSTENDRRRTPLDSFSSLSSPLDHSSILKEVENIRPQTENITQKDVEKLPVDELRKRAGALTQKLQRREQQCIALRAALENCNNRWNALHSR